MPLRRVPSLACLLLLLQAVVSGALPDPVGYVNDFADVLDAASRAGLEQRLRVVEQQTTAEIALVTVTSLEGMTVEAYANQLFQRWRIGKRAVDNGVLIVVAPADRQMRIEVGYGLEPVLPDGLAGSIIRSEFLPEFERGNLKGGIVNGVARVASIVQTRHVLTAEERRALDQNDDDVAPFIVVPFFAIFITLGAFAAGLGVRTRSTGPLIGGALFTGIPTLMIVATFFHPAVAILVPLAIGMFVIGYRKGATRYWQTMLRGSANVDPSTGWVTGGTSSDSSGSSHDFGGGSSGGGGASGRW